MRPEIANRDGRVCLHFAVRDTGIGIPQDKQQLIFEAFTQADHSTTRKYGGTGLGLTISAQLVAMMGGRIWVESERGQGQHLPLHGPVRPRRGPGAPAAAGPAGAPARAAGADRGRQRHQPPHPRGDADQLGMRPRAVDGGAAALAVLAAAAAAGEPFPLVLLDGHMPEMDGFTLAARIQADPQLAGATVLMLTSAGQPDDVARCRQLGMRAYLTKPVRQSELLETILVTLGGSPLHDPVGRRPRSRPRRRAARPLRILLAEDNAVNQKLALRLLEKQGHTVVIAGNGREAVDGAGEAAPSTWC